MSPEAQTPHDPELTDTDVEPETDAGPGKSPGRSGGKTAGEKNGRGSGRDPERRCIATMERLPQTHLVRFVLSPDGDVTPDLAARLPGRGAWVVSSRTVLATAVKKGAFGRAFKAQVKVAPDLPDVVDRLLAKRVLDMLGLAKRSGDLILGFEQVREAVRSERPACLIEASDGAEDGRSKMLGLFKAIHASDEAGQGFTEIAPFVAGCFSAGELGMALGRERVIHASLKRGRFAPVWMAELARLSGFRPLWPATWRPTDWRPTDWRPTDGRPTDERPNIPPGSENTSAGAGRPDIERPDTERPDTERTD